MLAYGIPTFRKANFIKYLYNMKSKQRKDTAKASVREQIMHSAMASFHIEDINISESQTQSTLKKIETNLEK